MRRFATAAVGYLLYSTARGRLHEIKRVHRRETRAAGQCVNVVAGQQHNFAGAHLDCGLAFNREKKPAGNDEVIGDQERGRRHERSEVLCGEPGDHAPGCREMSVEEDASRQPKRPKHVRKWIHYCGLPSIWTGGQVFRSDDHSPPRWLALCIAPQTRRPTDRRLLASLGRLWGVLSAKGNTMLDLSKTTSAVAAPDFAAIKKLQQATWSAGDYAVVGITLQLVGERLCEAVGVERTALTLRCR